MATNYVIQMKQYNGTDYDNLYPVGIAANAIIEATVGATLTATDGVTTLTGTSTGTYTFLIPNYGTWTFTSVYNSTTLIRTLIINVSQIYNIDLITSDILNDNSWDRIQQIAQASTGSNYWSVGDAKQITINGTVGLTSISNYSVWAFILGFNHNSSREGANRIHFQIGRTAQTYSTTNAICFVDSTYGSYNGNAGSFTMNPASDSTASTNSGGWNNSKMRLNLLGATATPTSPTANTFLAAMPSDLRAVMKSITKYSDNTGGGSNTASYVTATTDYLWLLAEYEVQGARTYANSAEQNYQLQYDYYKNGNSKIRYPHTSTGTTAYWWLRSVYSDYDRCFCYVNTGGGAFVGDSGYCYGVAPAFAVG